MFVLIWHTLTLHIPMFLSHYLLIICMWYATIMVIIILEIILKSIFTNSYHQIVCINDKTFKKKTIIFDNNISKSPLHQPEYAPFLLFLVGLNWQSSVLRSTVLFSEKCQYAGFLAIGRLYASLFS